MWRLLFLAPVGLAIIIPATWVLVSWTAKPLFPKPEDVPTAMHSAPPAPWAGTVDQARQIVRASVAGKNLPGLSVAVGINGNIVWAEGFGLADLPSNVTVTPDHRFRTGTASTVLTSAAAGLLLQQGRLKLGDEIQTYVPAFPKKQWPVTLRDVMGHTSGVVGYDRDRGPIFNQHCERLADALQYFAGDALVSKPGTQFRFSSSNWILVSAAVEAAAGQPFLTFMREKIFEPLGMRDTVPEPAPNREGEDFPGFIAIRELIYDPGAIRGSGEDTTRKPGPDQASPYFTRFRSNPTYGWHTARLLDNTCYGGASVFLSTPSDLVRFAMAMNSGKLLEPATVALLQTSQRLASGEDTGYGLGWKVKTVSLAGKPTRMVGHDGDSLGGMVASLMTFPDYAMAVAVTSNISFADTASIAERVAQTFAAQARGR